MNTHAPGRALLAATAVALTLGGGLAGCGSKARQQVQQELQDARQVVGRAVAHPYAAAATLEVERARVALDEADRSWAESRKREETRHLAYMAQRQGEIALAVAARAQSEAAAQQAQAERERSRVEAQNEALRQAQRQVESNNQRLAQEAARADALQRDLDALRAGPPRPAPIEAPATAPPAAAPVPAPVVAAAPAAAPPAAREAAGSVTVTIEDALFGSPNGDLSDAVYSRLERVAVLMRSEPGRRVRVEGFTDSQGDAPRNVALSRRRADAVWRVLKDLGVAPSRMDVIGHGEAQPIASNATAAGRQRNRRVEVTVSDAAGRFTASR